MSASSLPDNRLKTRLGKILDQLSRAPQSSIPACCATWADTLSIYRFLDNPKVDAARILSGHRQATLQRIAQQSLVFVVQDTTSPSYRVSWSAGLGTLTREDTEQYHLHVSMALTPDRVNLGILKSTCWQRQGVLDKADQRRPERRPLSERESHRWLDHYADACAIASACPQTAVVMLADRESDLHDLFAYAQQQPQAARADYIVRAKSNRRLLPGLLREELAQSPALGTFVITVPRRGTQPSRQAQMVLRARRLTLTSSKNYPRGPVTLSAVSAQESQAPAGVTPVDWMLLTSLEVASPEQAKTIVDWYAKRWEIEIFFRVLKQGCHIEEMRLQTASRVQNALAVYLIVAWRVHLITMLSRAYPASPADLAFSREEWETIYLLHKKKPPPAHPPSLRDTTRQLAQLGGFLARKGDGEPGVQALWIGYQRLANFRMARQVIEQLERKCV